MYLYHILNVSACPIFAYFFTHVPLYSRDEIAAERRRSSELQAELSSRVQEKLAAEGERERLGLEVKRLREQLQQQQHSSRQETAWSRQQPEPHTAKEVSSLSPVGRSQDEGFDQVAGELLHVQWRVVDLKKEAHTKCLGVTA